MISAAFACCAQNLVSWRVDPNDVPACQHSGRCSKSCRDASSNLCSRMAWWNLFLSRSSLQPASQLAAAFFFLGRDEAVSNETKPRHFSQAGLPHKAGCIDSGQNENPFEPRNREDEVRLHLSGGCTASSTRLRDCLSQNRSDRRAPRLSFGLARARWTYRTFP